MDDAIDTAKQFQLLLNSEKQSWLLGAGVSYSANIPLMVPLTAHILDGVGSNLFAGDDTAQYILRAIRSDCGDDSHIEHYLTYLSDLISIAARSRTGSVLVKCRDADGDKEIDKEIDKETLVEVHEKLIEKIASTVRWGLRPKCSDNSEDTIGGPTNLIVDISEHQKFINAVMRNRANLDKWRSPVEFFTTNYDTLIEDALALARVEFVDGFTGGGVGFWNSKNYDYDNSSGIQAIVFKLHGSIDWHRPQAENSILLRVRCTDGYPSRAGSVMIYPQARKYLDTQRAPFSEMFRRFRHSLSQGAQRVLLICGYSFGDEHINEEIEIAMSAYNNRLTILAFTDEPNGELPDTLREWLRAHWSDHLFVASPKGIYHGSQKPIWTTPDKFHDWWKFGNVADLLEAGLCDEILEGGNDSIRP